MPKRKYTKKKLSKDDELLKTFVKSVRLVKEHIGLSTVSAIKLIASKLEE